MKPTCLPKNAVLAFFNLAKLRTELFAARKSSLIWHHIPVMRQPVEKINRLLNAINHADNTCPQRRIEPSDV